MTGVLFVGVAGFFHHSTVGAELVGHVDMSKAMPFHRFLKEFQCSLAIPFPGDEGFKNFSFGCWQTNANQSPYGRTRPLLSCTELAPLVESGGAVDLEDVSAGEAAFLVEVV